MGKAREVQGDQSEGVGSNPVEEGVSLAPRVGASRTGGWVDGAQGTPAELARLVDLILKKPNLVSHAP